MTDFAITSIDGEQVGAMVEFEYRGWQIAAVRLSTGEVQARAFKPKGNKGTYAGTHSGTVNSVQSAIEFVNDKENIVPTGSKGRRGILERMSANEKFVFFFTIALFLWGIGKGLGFN